MELDAMLHTSPSRSRGVLNAIGHRVSLLPGLHSWLHRVGQEGIPKFLRQVDDEKKKEKTTTPVFTGVH
ncbi:hypothetical protein HaLaN_17455 [Haematococcus lacustris]|uniref:Uncharacterized protein n=1 Tax=Haematococcus lacustris TaxID=44745 RepID=A0A699ZCB5_HAELA|nr:hypothetical protein HaLaN_17455 [Haematococcus lacustris]